MIACAYSGEMFWLSVGIALLCIITALYEQGRHTNEERLLLEALRVIRRERDYAVLEAEFTRTDPGRLGE